MIKYKLDKSDTLKRGSAILFRVVKLDGAKGGYVQFEHNLSQEGECWIHGNSEVSGDAKVLGDAQVYGKVYGRAVVSGNSKVHGSAFDSAKVSGRANVIGRVWGRALVCDDARIFGEAYGDAVVGGSATILGKIYGNARASGNEIVTGNRTAPSRPGMPSLSRHLENIEEDRVPQEGSICLIGKGPSAPDGNIMRLQFGPTFKNFIEFPSSPNTVVSWKESSVGEGMVEVCLKPGTPMHQGIIISNC